MNKKLIFITIIGFVVAEVLIVFLFFMPKTSQIEQPQLQQTTDEQKPLQVSASFYPLYFFAQQIAGDRAEVLNITPNGIEPHEYEPTAQDMVVMQSSKLLIINGGLEPWADNLQENLDPQKTVIITVSDGIAYQQIKEDDATVTDPHIWQSPPLVKEIVNKIAQGFMQVDSANKEYYQTNADALNVELDQLDMQYRQGLAHCVDKNIITSHAAFGYLATTYGLNQVPITGLSPDAEPSGKQLAEIITFAKEHNVKYIFFESLVSPKLANTIAKEVKAKTLVLNPLEGLTSQEIEQGKNYISVMQDNLANLKIALQCQ